MDLGTGAESDPGWPPDVDDPDEVTINKQVVEDETEYGATLQPAKDRVNWLQKVRNMSTEDLLTLKVVANLKLLNHIYMTWRGGKVIHCLLEDAEVFRYS